MGMYVWGGGGVKCGTFHIVGMKRSRVVNHVAFPEDDPQSLIPK